MDFQAGEILYINKPLHWTSFDVVNKIKILLRNHFGIKKIKVGHAGTLDPLATGMVIVCTGKATKRIEEFMGLEKEYLATIKLGSTTPSFDLETGIDAEYPYSHITLGMIETVVKEKFIGEIDQIPPVFSAIKIKGQRAYDMARKGKDVEIESRKVTIYNIDIENFDPPFVVLRIRCSKGTYIRSLARDLGQALESGGHLVKLVRTRIGEWTLREAQFLAELSEVFERIKAVEAATGSPGTDQTV
jgi:tRNA pseudouridine55 synthase